MSGITLTREAFVSAFVKQYGVTLQSAERAADRKFGTLKASAPARPVDTASLRLSAEQIDPARSVLIRGRRVADALWMEIVTPPRTKKNSAETLGSSKSKAYKAYLRAMLEALAEVHDALQLPLPDRAAFGYNLCAHFHTDRHGNSADLVGLLQGLNDALQDAGVVSDYWLFRQHDGSRAILASLRPRVALWITPILSVSLDTPEVS